MNANRSSLVRLWLLNLAGNAALLGAIYCWLILPDSRAWQVAASGLVAVCVLLLGLWLRAGTFAYFRVPALRENSKLWASFRHGLRHIVALALWGVLLVAIGWGLFWLQRYPPQFGVWFRQKMPALLRASLSPRQVTHAAEGLLWFVLVVLLPALWLPVATTVAAAGLAAGRMARSLRVVKRPLYWIGLCAFMCVVVYVPYKLIAWVPAAGDLRAETWSMGLRFLAAYFILVTALMGLVWFVASQVDQHDGTPIDFETASVPSAPRGTLIEPIQS